MRLPVQMRERQRRRPPTIFGGRLVRVFDPRRRRTAVYLQLKTNVVNAVAWLSGSVANRIHTELVAANSFFFFGKRFVIAGALTTNETPQLGRIRVPLRR